jgi:hypothetical protein
MRRGSICLALCLAACGHAHEAEVVSSFEPKATLGQTFTADTTRLAANADAGQKALIELLEGQLAAVGKPRPDVVGPEHIDLVTDLPAPGYALRARVTPKPDNLCLVMIEPLATQPNDHAVDAAPWSVQEAFEIVRRRAPTLLPSKLPPMPPARFARLREEATDAAKAGRDPALSPSEYVRVPRPISREGEDTPYYTPPAQTKDLPAPVRE